jgi:hypothetical protein
LIIDVLVRRFAHRWQALDAVVTVYITAFQIVLFMLNASVYCFCSGSQGRVKLQSRETCEPSLGVRRNKCGLNYIGVETSDDMLA